MSTCYCYMLGQKLGTWRWMPPRSSLSSEDRDTWKYISEQWADCSDSGPSLKEFNRLNSQVTKQTHRPLEPKEPRHFISRDGVDSGVFPGQACFHESFGGGRWLGRAVGPFWARVPCFGPLCQQHGNGRLVTRPGVGSCSGYWLTKGRTSVLPLLLYTFVNIRVFYNSIYYI